MGESIGKKILKSVPNHILIIDHLYVIAVIWGYRNANFEGIRILIWCPQNDVHLTLMGIDSIIYDGSKQE